MGKVFQKFMKSSYYKKAVCGFKTFHTKISLSFHFIFPQTLSSITCFVCTLFRPDYKFIETCCYFPVDSHPNHFRSLESYRIVGGFASVFSSFIFNHWKWAVNTLETSNSSLQPFWCNKKCLNLNKIDLQLKSEWLF